MNKIKNGLVVGAVCFFFGIGVGNVVTYFCFPRIIEQRVEVEKPVVRETVRTNTLTEIQYVEKEIDPFTGKREDTDVETNIKQPSIGVKVNGKPYEFGLLQGETQKFENGKIVMNQESTIKFEVEVPTIHQKWRVGTYAEWGTSKNYPDVGARLNRQFKRWDGDVYINQDKDVKGQVTIWF